MRRRWPWRPRPAQRDQLQSGAGSACAPTMTGLDSPVLVTNAHDGSKPAVRRRAARDDPGLPAGVRSSPRRISTSGRGSPPAASAGSSAWPSTRSYATNGKFYVDFTRSGDGRHHRRRVPVRLDQLRGHRPASSFRQLLRINHRTLRQPQRRDDRLRSRRLPVHRDGRRRRRGRPAPQRPDPALAARQDPADRRERQPVRSRLPDPVDEPVRPEHGRTAARSGRAACATRGGSPSTGHRRPVDRRCRPEPLRGGRSGDPVVRAGTGRELRLADDGRPYACYAPSRGCNTTGLRLPVAVYGHTLGCAIIGGYVYRGPIALLRGAYLFGDACSGRIWSARRLGRPPARRRVLMADTSAGDHLVR